MNGEQNIDMSLEEQYLNSPGVMQGDDGATVGAELSRAQANEVSTID
jgi:hypothetical protein